MRWVVIVQLNRYVSGRMMKALASDTLPKVCITVSAFPRPGVHGAQDEKDHSVLTSPDSLQFIQFIQFIHFIHFIQR